MGLYSALSSVQCGGAPGGLYHEDLDAAAYQSWGLDYLKYVCCITLHCGLHTLFYIIFLQKGHATHYIDKKIRRSEQSP